MLAVVKSPAVRGIAVRDVEIPNVDPSGVLLRVEAVGICGSDKRIYSEVDSKRTAAFIIGHEVAGKVVRVGRDVKLPFVGMSVGVCICHGCGNCCFCHQGQVNLCESVQEFGVTIDGGMAEYMTAPATNICPLPRGLTCEQAVLADPLACVIHSATMNKIDPGAWVVVLGPGPLGLLATQMFSRKMEARVAVAGTREPLLQLARKMGVFG